MPFLTAAELAVVDPDIRASTRNAVGEFIQVIKDGATYVGDLRKVVEMIIDKAGLIRALQDEGTDEARAATALEAVRRCAEAISYSVSPETCIDAMLFEIREVLYGSHSAD